MSTTTVGEPTIATRPTATWQTREGREYLFTDRMTFRVYRRSGNGSTDPAYAKLELLTQLGWTTIEHWGLGDTYYGLSPEYNGAINRLKAHAEFLVSNNAQIAESAAW